MCVQSSLGSAAIRFFIHFFVIIGFQLLLHGITHILVYEIPIKRHCLLSIFSFSMFSQKNAKKDFFFINVSKLITSMMWPSQNFLLYNGSIIKIKVNEWINN